MSHVKLVKKHPLAIRIFHWFNFYVLAMMVWSGMLIYWANDVYFIRFGDFTLFHFFPESFYEALNLKFKLAKGMSFHFTFMWFFIFNGLAYMVFLLVSKQYTLLLPDKRSFKEAWKVVLHDLHIKRGLPPQLKYNAAQRIAYTLVFSMGVLIVLTGLAMYKPVQLQWLCNLLGGYGSARAIHFTITMLFCLFFIIHIVQVIVAGWQNFQGIVTGFEIEKNKNTGLKQE